jgi:hypothetical protein
MEGEGLMPCFDYGGSNRSWDAGEIEALTRKINRLEAMLCAVISVSPDIIDRIDENESGIKKAMLKVWWKDHQAEDERRRKREREAAERERIRKSALNKLTPAERKLLGLK